MTVKRSVQARSFRAGLARVPSDAAGLVESLNACGAGVRPGLSSRRPAAKQEPSDVSPGIPVVHGREDVNVLRHPRGSTAWVSGERLDSSAGIGAGQFPHKRRHWSSSP